MYKLLALAFATYFASSSFAAPRAHSAEEGGIAADMALVAQSLARKGNPSGELPRIRVR